MDNGAMPDAGVVISSICCRICLKMNHSEIQRKNDHYVYIYCNVGLFWGILRSMFKYLRFPHIIL